MGFDRRARDDDARLVRLGAANDAASAAPSRAQRSSRSRFVSRRSAGGDGGVRVSSFVGDIFVGDIFVGTIFVSSRASVAAWTAAACPPAKKKSVSLRRAFLLAEGCFDAVDGVVSGARDSGSVFASVGSGDASVRSFRRSWAARCSGSTYRTSCWLETGSR